MSHPGAGVSERVLAKCTEMNFVNRASSIHYSIEEESCMMVCAHTYNPIHVKRVSMRRCKWQNDNGLLLRFSIA